MRFDQLDYTPGKGFRVRIRYGKGLRGRFWIKLTDEELAETRAVRLRELADMLGRAGHSARAPIILEEAGACQTEGDFAEAVQVAEALCTGKGIKRRGRQTGSTFRQLGERWTDGALARDFADHVSSKKTAELDRTRLDSICDVVIAPGLTFGALPLDAVTLDHCQTVMANLPKTAKRPATRRQYAQIIHRVLELAVFPCRLLTANPLPKGFMPKAGKPPKYPYLYPSEEAALVAHVPIPLARRMLWGFLAREGCRSGEAVGMQLGIEVDLERGVVTLVENKTDDPRAWAMDPGVARALRRWVDLRGATKGAYLFTDDNGEPFENESGLAKVLRADLEAAGVDRHELFNAGENTGMLRAHDLRGTFVTLNLALDKTETWISDRTGHGSSVMINRYRRAARTAAELGLGPLPPLDRIVPELAQGGPVGGPEISKPTEEPNDVIGKEAVSMLDAECRRWELNPHTPYGIADFESAASASSATSAGSFVGLLAEREAFTNPCDGAARD